MKRASRLFNRILERDNLRLAFNQSLRGKRHRSDARAFAAALEANLASMARDVHEGRFVLGRSRQFTIYDPKHRVITAPCFAEHPWDQRIWGTGDGLTPEERAAK